MIDLQESKDARGSEVLRPALAGSASGLAGAPGDPRAASRGALAERSQLPMHSRTFPPPSVLKIVALYLLALALVGLGLAQALTQVLADGPWPLPIGVLFVLAGAFLWALGTRARLDRRSRESA